MKHAGLLEMDLYLEGELDGPRKERLEAHLGQCPACRDLLEERRALLAAFSSLAPIEVPPAFAASVLSRIPARSRSRNKVAAGILATFGFWFLSAAVFLALAPWLLPDAVSKPGRWLSLPVGGLVIFFGRMLNTLAALAKLLGIAVHIASQWLDSLIHLLSPGVLALLLGLTLLAAAAAFFGLKRFIYHGAKP